MKYMNRYVQQGFNPIAEGSVLIERQEQHQNLISEYNQVKRHAHGLVIAWY